jgi:hypothetical protein
MSVVKSEAMHYYAFGFYEAPSDKYNASKWARSEIVFYG